MNAPRHPTSRRWAILVVSDKPVVRARMIDVLCVAGDVSAADDSVGALHAVAARGSPFDIVIVECMRSPRTDVRACSEFVRSLFRRSPWLSIVLLTSPRDASRLAAELLLSGVRQVLRGPFRSMELTRAIEAVLRKLRQRPPVTPGVIGKVKRTLRFFGDDLADVPTLDDLAARATMSRSHFSHMFSAVIGMSLRTYVRNLRLQRASDLLLGSMLSVTAVAVECGFYDLPHLDKAFRRRLGMSPHAFRARYAKPRKPG
jgi:AraC-like DNA-binding protein